MALSKRLRYEILRRDNHACRYCGGAAPDVRLTVDHVVPVSLGGGDDPANLVAACIDCNAGKTSSSPDAPIVADVAADALRWAHAMQAAAAQQAADREAETDFIAMCWSDLGQTWRDQFPVPDDYVLTLRTWYRAGLSTDDFSHAVDVATDNPQVRAADKWRYICGVAWRMLDERQTAAREILDVEGVR